MKKLMVFLLAAIVIFCFAGCKTKGAESTYSEPEETVNRYSDDKAEVDDIGEVSDEDPVGEEESKETNQDLEESTSEEENTPTQDQ